MKGVGVVASVLLLSAGGAWAQRPVATEAAPEEAAAQAEAGTEDEAGRIIGGRNATANELPFQVQIFYGEPDPANQKGVQQWQMAHKCGGVLIAPDWVLTAAHCFFPGNGKPKPGEKTLRPDPTDWFSVRAGTIGITAASSPGVVGEVAEIRVHPGYVPCSTCGTVSGAQATGAYATFFTHDIALIRLKRPMPLSASVQPVRLYDPARDQRLAPARPVVASGWGLASNDAATEARVLGAARPQGGNSLVRAKAEPILQVAELQIVPCTGEGELPTHFCAGGRAGQDTCMGDSGGPLVMQRPDGAVLVGITSRRAFKQPLCGAGKGGKQVETRYSRVDGEHSAWIAAEIKRRP